MIGQIVETFISDIKVGNMSLRHSLPHPSCLFGQVLIQKNKNLREQLNGNVTRTLYKILKFDAGKSIIEQSNYGKQLSINWICLTPFFWVQLYTLTTYLYFETS